MRAWADGFEALHPEFVPSRWQDRVPGCYPAVGEPMVDRAGKEARAMGASGARRRRRSIGFGCWKYGLIPIA